MRNSLYHGDCKEIFSSLKSNSVNLIYLDPPFFTNREFEICDNGNNHLYFKDLWENDINKYLDFMNDILNQSIRVLKKTGLVFLHCDYHASHYLKIEMDKTFGLKNFRNEIIWKRHNSQNNAKQGSKIFGRTHDTILIYSKTNNYFWNHQFSEYSETYLKKTYNKVDSDTGERYALGDLSGPGGSSKGNPFFEFLGFKKYWRYNEEKMNQLLAKNKIVQTTPNTVPKFKRYLKDMNGVQLNDIWTDIPNAQTSNRKEIVYPTQKPLKLLDRIINTASKKDDLVLDPFCGSGTSLISAELQGRNWIGMDKSIDAIQASISRLKNIRTCKKYDLKKMLHAQT